MINTTKTECESKLCYYDSATRTRFYHGMLLTDDHLRAEQEYHREALKRANRHLWGSGVVCGLKVEKIDASQQRGLCIRVQPGVALDCCGNLIEVCKCITVDLTKECEKRFGSDCMPAQSVEPIFKYLVLRYKEIESDPEPVLTPETDCSSATDKPSCNASKVREGFCIELSDECPCPEETPADEKGLMATLVRLSRNDRRAADLRYQQPKPQQAQQPPPPPPGGPAPGLEEGNFIDLPLPCSPCGCCESAVGLAKLTINCSEKTVKIEYECRRTIITPRLLSWLFSRIQPKHMSTEMSAVYQEMPDPAVANLAVAGVAVEAQGHEIRELKDTVEKQNKKVETFMKKAGRTGLPKKP